MLINSDNLLLRYYCIQVLERIHRMESLLFAARPYATAADDGLLSTLSDHVGAIRTEFFTILEGLGDPQDELNEYTYTSVLQFAGSCFRGIDEAHLQLRHLRGKWTQPETPVFIKALFGPILGTEKKTMRLGVVPSDEYVFEAADVSNYLSTASAETPTLFLPKLEAGNPLHWGTLVHEMGHALADAVAKVFEDPAVDGYAQDAAGFQPKNLEMLRNWSEEFYCDALAIKLLGPAYLASFADFLVLPGTRSDLLSWSSTHPAPRWRVSTMSELLRKSSINQYVAFEAPLAPEWGDLGSFFTALYHGRASRKLALRRTPVPQAELDVRAFDELILPKILALPEAYSGTFLDARKLPILSARLRRGVPIGTSRLCDLGDARAAEREASENLRALGGAVAEGAGGVHRISGPLSKLQEAVREVPSTIPEIINSGWLYKVEHIYFPAMMELNSFSEMQGQMFANKLIELDGLLRISIETASLAQILQAPISKSVP